MKNEYFIKSPRAAAKGGLSRRHALGMLGALGSLPLAGCGGGGNSSTADSSTDSSDSAGTSSALASLTVSSGTLVPAFEAAVTSYTLSLTNAVDSLVLTAVTEDAAASLTIDGETATSGSASAVALAVGSNAIELVVGAEDGSSTTYTITALRASAASGGNCALIPSETAGPYPLLAILSNSAVVRQDVREDREGVPVTVLLSFENINDSCAPVSGAAVYLWHCDKDGSYSGYSSGNNGDHSGETFLRGIQLTDAAGQVGFTTIYPGWYAGRITHMHFQVYLNDNLQVSATVTSQIAFPQSVTSAVYNSPLYAARGQNTSVASFAEDNVFSDGTELQMATVEGSVDDGYTVSLVVGLAI